MFEAILASLLKAVKLEKTLRKMSSNDNPRGGQGSTALRNRRTTSSSSSSEKVISTEDLREYFECPICFNVPRSPPIYACGVGHMICRVCRPKLKNCPTCRMPYPPPGTQNHRLYFAEKLLEERIPIACMFAPFGCDVELTGGEIKRHEEACPCQPLPCPLKGCSALVSRGKLKTHTDKCEYRLISCPLTPTCDQKVAKNSLLRHLQEEHLSFKGIFTIDRSLFLVLLSLCVFSLLFNLYLLYLLQQ